MMRDTRSRTYPTRRATQADLPAIQALARAQIARDHARDPRLPARMFVPEWTILPQHGACWLALDRGRVVGALSATPEAWAEWDPFANVFPRRYLRLTLYRLSLSADETRGVLAALLAGVEDWAEAIPGRMVMTAVHDAALTAALRAMGFAPYHAIAHRPLEPPPDGARGSGVVTRTADWDDVPAIATLMAESWRFHAAHQPAIQLSDSLLADCQQQAATLLGDGMGQTLIAERQGAVVGFFCLGLNDQVPSLPGFFDAGCYGDIFEVAVRGDQRRQGVGRALFRAAWDWLAGQGVGAMFVNYAPTNPASSRFWPRLGFADAWVVWWRA